MPVSQSRPWPRFLSPAHRTGRADFPHPAFGRDHAFARGPPGRGGGRTGDPARMAVTRRPSCLPHPRRCAAKPVYASTTSNRSGSTPSLLHVTLSGLSAIGRGHRQSHSRRLSPFPHRSRTRAPSLRRHYPASPVLHAHPPPCRPGLPLAGVRLVRAHHRQGFPCCCLLPLPCVPPPLPRRNPPVLASLASRSVAAFPT